MQISKEKREKILEQILNLLFIKTPEALFTSHIAKDIARDEEFTKTLLSELKRRDLVVGINKSTKGFLYKKRQRWCLTDRAYLAFVKIQQ